VINSIYIVMTLFAEITEVLAQSVG
jgi:hypothetical protein